MPKATSVTRGSSASSRKSTGSTERNAAKVVESARKDAARLRAEAEEHARRLVLDARATADGVRAEGMEVVSNLRQISDALREMSDRVLEDVEAIHARMIDELKQVDPEAATGPPAEPDAPGDSSAGDALDVPDFVQPQ